MKSKKYISSTISRRKNAYCKSNGSHQEPSSDWPWPRDIRGIRLLTTRLVHKARPLEVAQVVCPPPTPLRRSLIILPVNNIWPLQVSDDFHPCLMNTCVKLPVSPVCLNSQLWQGLSHTISLVVSFSTLSLGWTKARDVVAWILICTSSSLSFPPQPLTNTNYTELTL